MATKRVHLKTEMQTAAIATLLRVKGPMTKTEIVQATGIAPKRFSNLTQSWRNNPSNLNPFKHSGVKKGSKWAVNVTPSKDTKVVDKIVEVEKIVEVPVNTNLDALSCAISVVNIMHFMNDNGITTMRFGNGLVAELAGDNGINFIRE